ncbi:hypothetical protein Pelo_4041 [Pelomyxa schiedti]|nr:hypothetical protein Pelo_4041 [Pelomyxa schiedti]
MGDNRPVLTKEDFSSVWKEGGNVDKSTGAKLDLVQHLKNQLRLPMFAKAKEFVVTEALGLLGLAQAGSCCYAEIGCGIGNDLIAVARELQKLCSANPGATGPFKVIGIDANPAMLTASREAVSMATAQGDFAPVVVEIIQDDANALSMLGDGSVDVVRSDITMQHLDLRKAMAACSRVLKPNGRLVCLEGGIHGFYTPDPIFNQLYDRIVPVDRTGSTGIQLYYHLKEFGFGVPSLTPFPVLHLDAAGMDPGWVKLKGMASMCVTKGVLSQAEADDYTARYIKAAETNSIVSGGCMFVVVAVRRA